jgi:DNA-binding HxlR family transcriptional regulator
LVTMDNNQFDATDENCSADNCQANVAFLIIGEKWKSAVLYALGNHQVVRLNQLKLRIAQISQKMLTQQLRELERDGLINRKAYPEIPPRVEYSLTELGLSLGSIYKAVFEWQQENFETIVESRNKYDAGSTKSNKNVSVDDR